MRRFYSPDRIFTCPFKPNGVYVGKLSCKCCEYYIGQDHDTVYCSNNQETIFGTKIKETLEQIVSYIKMQIECSPFADECHLNKNLKN